MGENGCSDEELGDIFPVLRYFDYGHLTQPHLRAVSQQFHDAAWNMARNARLRQPVVQEAEVALRKMLEAKDAYVRNQL